MRNGRANTMWAGLMVLSCTMAAPAPRAARSGQPAAKEASGDLAGRGLRVGPVPTAPRSQQWGIVDIGVDMRAREALVDLGVGWARVGLKLGEKGWTNKLVMIRQIAAELQRSGVGVWLTLFHTPAFARTAPEHIPERLKGALEPVLETIAMLTGNIQQYERQIARLCQKRYPETQQLQQVAGVGALTALAYVLTLEEPERFNSSRAVGPYLGLRPKKRQSGDKDPALRITKAGDKMLRRLLVGSAHYILGPFGPDTELRRWGLKLAGRGGPHGNKKAAVAVARKLAVVLHRLWLSGDEYEPLRGPLEVPAA